MFFKKIIKRAKLINEIDSYEQKLQHALYDYNASGEDENEFSRLASYYRKKISELKSELNSL